MAFRDRIAMGVTAALAMSVIIAGAHGQTADPPPRKLRSPYADGGTQTAPTAPPDGRTRDAAFAASAGDPYDRGLIERLIVWRLALDSRDVRYDSGSVRDVSEALHGNGGWRWVTADFSYNGGTQGRIAIAWRGHAPVCVGFAPDPASCATLDGERGLAPRQANPAAQGLGRGLIDSATCPWKDVSGHCN